MHLNYQLSGSIKGTPLFNESLSLSLFFSLLLCLAFTSAHLRIIYSRCRAKWHTHTSTCLYFCVIFSPFQFALSLFLFSLYSLSFWAPSHFKSTLQHSQFQVAQASSSLFKIVCSEGNLLFARAKVMLAWCKWLIIHLWHVSHYPRQKDPLWPVTFFSLSLLSSSCCV